MWLSSGHHRGRFHPFKAPLPRHKAEEAKSTRMNDNKDDCQKEKKRVRRSIYSSTPPPKGYDLVPESSVVDSEGNVHHGPRIRILYMTCHRCGKTGDHWSQDCSIKAEDAPNPNYGLLGPVPNPESKSETESESETESGSESESESESGSESESESENSQ